MRELLGSLETVRHLVSARIRATLSDATDRLAHIGPETVDLTEAAEDLLSGGKRLRAAFCCAGWSACGGPAARDLGSPVIAAGASLELFQAAALAHDDVMDGSLTRRGLPAAHRRFAALHAERAWLGSAERFGEAAAILLGDLLLVTSFREFATALRGVPAGSARIAQDVYDLMTAEVTLGQYLDMVAQAAPAAPTPQEDLDRAERVVRAKSARYSVEHPIVLGAAMAGGTPAQLRTCARFGLPIGEAFQLRDDVLGVFGDPSVTGKPAGDDLREGKRTVLVALAQERAGADERRVLESNLGRADLDDAGIARLREILVATGALAEVESLIESRAAAGFRVLDESDLDERAVVELGSLAHLAIDRQA